MADEKTMEQLIAEASPQFRETYAELGGLEQLLVPSDNPVARIQAATQYGENLRANAKMEEENRAREKRKEQMAKDAEAQAKARHAEDEKLARAEEARLKARMRSEMPLMTDEAFEAAWPELRTAHYRAEHTRRMHAIENDGNVFGEMRSTNF